jgi:hypothetical protein
VISPRDSRRAEPVTDAPADELPGRAEGVSWDGAAAPAMVPRPGSGDPASARYQIQRPGRPIP